ncbi:MAG: exosortase/archaeosortase family protein [Bryobacteraceae bacterium]
MRSLPFLRSIPRSLSFLLVFLVLLVPFWQPLNLLFRLSLQSDRYTHIIFVPFISLCVFYFERKAILPNAHYAPRIGIPVLAFGLILFWFLKEHPSSTETASLFRLMPSIILVWAVGFLLCYGAQSLRAASFPVCFLLLMVPIPVGVLNQITVGLQKGSADLSYLLFKISGIPVFRQGFRFSLPGVEIEIAEQCSGIRSSLALLITSILAGHLFLRSWWSKGLLVLFTIPVVILKNSVRIVTISALGVYVNRAFLHGNLHRHGGLLFALLAVLMLVPALVLLQRAERRLGRDSASVQ